MGIDVEQACATFDGAYTNYQGLLEKGDATAEQIASARDDLVSTLEGFADDIGGKPGELIRSNAKTLAGSIDPSAPESIEAVEKLKGAVEAFCG